MEETRCLDDFDPDFKYQFSNDSHSWLINFPDNLKPDPNALKISSTNETYTEHEIRRHTTKGKRKKLMEDFYRKVISEEILSSLGEENLIIEEYATDYMEKFKNPDDMPLPGETLSKNEKLKKESNLNSCSSEPSDKSKLEELKAKYPLYLSTPVTYFSHTTGRSHFRKNSTITKSPDQNYDNIELKSDLDIQLHDPNTIHAQETSKQMEFSCQSKIPLEHSGLYCIRSDTLNYVLTWSSHPRGCCVFGCSLLSPSPAKQGQILLQLYVESLGKCETILHDC